MFDVALNYSFYPTRIFVDDGTTVLQALAAYAGRDEQKLRRDILASGRVDCVRVHGPKTWRPKAIYEKALDYKLLPGDRIEYTPTIDVDSEHYKTEMERLCKTFGVPLTAPFPRLDSWGL